MESDERKLIEEARQGDAQAFRTLVERYQKRAYAVALGMMHNPDDARDVCQEAFLKAHRNLDRFEGEARFYTWLHRIVINVAIDQIRKRRGNQVEFDEAIASGEADDSGIAPKRLGFDPQRALSDRELRGQLQAALARLSPEHRAVLLMREIDGLSYEEMADQAGVAIGTIMSRLFHARRKMQKMLLEHVREAS